MPEPWSNWSGSIRFAPQAIERPSTDGELSAIIRRTASEHGTIRPVGTGHTSSGLLATDGTLVSLERMQGIASYDMQRCEATVIGGTTLKDASAALLEIGMAMPTLGDVNVQTVAGTIATGTHGSGRTLQNLATMLVGGRLVTADGNVRDFSIDRDHEFVRAVRVSIGALGVLTAMRLRLMPAFRLRRREWCTTTDCCLTHLDDLVAGNRNFDFYWYPRSDLVKLRILNPPDVQSEPLPYARCVEDTTGWSGTVIPKERLLRFEEMEYALPAGEGPACFAEIRERIRERHRKHVGWRVLYRIVAADDAYLSPAYGRETVTISLHQNATLPYQAFFADIEPIFRHYGGRPHWAKKHSLGAADLGRLYPEWDRFGRIRESLDPHGLFVTPPLRRILGDPVR